MKCTVCNRTLSKRERESFVPGYPFPACDPCSKAESAKARIAEILAAIRAALAESTTYDEVEARLIGLVEE